MKNGECCLPYDRRSTSSMFMELVPIQKQAINQVHLPEGPPAVQAFRETGYIFTRILVNNESKSLWKYVQRYRILSHLHVCHASVVLLCLSAQFCGQHTHANFTTETVDAGVLDVLSRALLSLDVRVHIGPAAFQTGVTALSGFSAQGLARMPGLNVLAQAQRLWMHLQHHKL